LEIDHCEFPDELYFNTENDVWLLRLDKSKVKIGITSILLFLSGGVAKVKLKTELSRVTKGLAVATIESSTYFGAVRSPVEGEISRFNMDLAKDPQILNESPYERGWIAEISTKEELPSDLLKGEAAREKLRARIKELRVRCFKELPDEKMVSVGTECSATLANLSELLRKRPQGYKVHLVTDEPGADIEMIRWSDQTKNDVVDFRQEEKLYHFLVKKTKESRT
jgi:glycine cleavage system H protein